MRILSVLLATVALCGLQLLVVTPGIARGDERHSHDEHDAHRHHGSSDQDQGHHQSSESASVAAENVTLFDLDLLDQDGRPVRFRSDIVRDRLVVMNFVFTTCPSVCPVQSSIFARLQKELGERMGKDVFLVSVSIDPKTDVPARLREYAARYKAGPGWIWLTGKKENIDRVLLGVGAYSRDFAEHPAMILVGDGEHGGWTRFYGFPKPSAILGRIEALSAARRDRELAAVGSTGQ